MPDPYASPSQARTYYAGEDTSGVLLSVPMGIAADLVQHYAPAPDPVTTDYEDRAVRAELEIGRYLFNTQGGAMSGASPGGGMTVSYNSDPAIFRIIRRAMGSYASAGKLRLVRTQRG